VLVPYERHSPRVVLEEVELHVGLLAAAPDRHVKELEAQTDELFAAGPPSGLVLPAAVAEDGARDQHVVEVQDHQRALAQLAGVFHQKLVLEAWVRD
jgi:hypothetical protein